MHQVLEYVSFRFLRHERLLSSVPRIALSEIALPLLFSSDAVNGIRSPMQNPVRGTLAVKDIGGEAQHRQPMVVSCTN